VSSRKGREGKSYSEETQVSKGCRRDAESEGERESGKTISPPLSVQQVPGDSGAANRLIGRRAPSRRRCARRSGEKGISWDQGVELVEGGRLGLLPLNAGVSKKYFEEPIQAAGAGEEGKRNSWRELSRKQKMRISISVRERGTRANSSGQFELIINACGKGERGRKRSALVTRASRR